MKIDWKALILAILLCESAGIAGSVFTTPAIPTWYASLNKPSFAPPGSVIGAVWIILYFLMAISLYLVQVSKSRQKGIATKVFGVQLFLNMLWSLLFFGLRSPLYGMIGIIILWLAILATIVKFYKVSKTAAYLMIPYILWVSFASFLNYLILVLN